MDSLAVSPTPPRTRLRASSQQPPQPPLLNPNLSSAPLQSLCPLPPPCRPGLGSHLPAYCPSLPGWASPKAFCFSELGVGHSIGLSQAPFLLCRRAKAQVLPETRTALCDLPLSPVPHSLASPPRSLPLAHSAPATWTSWLFVRHARLRPASGPLHQRLLPPGAHLVQGAARLSPTASPPLGLSSDVTSQVKVSLVHLI